MIIVRTPYRVSFFGGGTDYPAWFEEHGGDVLGTSIAYYSYIHGRNLPPFFNHKYLISYSKIEKTNSIDEIKHPVVRESIRHLKISQGLEIQHHGDLPARSGLGSSSSFSASILNMLHILKGEQVIKENLAKESIYLEQTLLNENVGVQDQILTVHGGLNHVKIEPNGEFKVNKLELTIKKKKQFESNILMFYTGVSRFASKVAADSIRAIPKKQADLFEMQKMVDIAIKTLTNGKDIDDLGLLLNESWKIKRSLSSSIAPDFVDDIYSKAIKAGALGGKLLGAGGGGFMIFYVQTENKQQVLDALSGLLLVPFKTEEEGSKVIYNENQQYSLTAMSGNKEFLKRNIRK
jgi:D-glycero-alpha-D-manno-heptose-7-phosphate kinase